MTTSLLTVFILSYSAAAFGQMIPSGRRNIWGTRRANLIGFIFSGVIMVLFSGLRRTIGDTPFYIYSYNLATDSEIIKPLWGENAYLFKLLEYYLHINGAEASSLVFFTSAVTLIPILLFIYKYSFDYRTAVFFLFATGLYVTSMNGIRQFTAAGIILLGAKFLFSPKKTGVVMFLLLVLLAYLFHSSALFMIPVYFLCRQKAWSAPTFIILGAGIVGLVFVSLFLPSFLGMIEDTNYSVYSQGWFTEGVESGTGVFRVAFNILPMVLSIIFSSQLRRLGPVADILINLSVVNAAIFILATYNWIFARFAIYIYPYVVLLLGLIFSYALKQSRSKWMYAVLVVCYFIFFVKDSFSNGMISYSSEFFTPNNNTWFDFLA